MSFRRRRQNSYALVTWCVIPRRFARGTKLVAVADRQEEIMSERQIHDQRILARFHERLTVEKWYKKAVCYIQLIVCYIQ